MRPLFLLIPLLLIHPASAADDMVQGAPADEAAARMVVPPGFSVDLIASEPGVVQPIAFCFDACGRIWVAEGLTYPERAPEGQGRDRIVIFEDSDGDGTFETRKVFAEGLNLVSGIEIAPGGLYVGAAPYLLFLADADGDDRADGEPQVLLDGFGYQDTHETLNSFIWGPDGWLYGCHGIFTHSRVGKPGTPDPERVPINAGIWRFHPVTHDFEVVAHGTSNPWGLDFNDYGEAFIEACVIPHLWHIIPGGYYERQAGTHFNPHIYEPIRTIADHRHWVGDIADHAHWGHENAIPENVSDVGGGHAHSGFAICLSDSFPAEMRGSALFFNIHGHRLNRDILERDGSGWVGKHAPDLLLSKDEWFLGVSIKPGPDGSFYFIDWHDATSCHRTDPLRWDRENGRVFRLRHGDLKPWKGDLALSSDLELATLQAGRDEWQLRTARRLLQERVASGKALDPQAVDHLKNTLRSHEDPTRRLRALWTLHACGLLNADLLPVDSPDEWLRSWSFRLASEVGTALLPEDSWKQTATEETAPAALLALCSALQKLPAPLAFDLAAIVAPKIDPKDPNLSRMLWFGLERLVSSDEARAIAISLSCEDPRLLQWTARRLTSVDPLLAACSQADPAAIRRLLDAVTHRLDHHPDERLSSSQLQLIEGFRSHQDPEIDSLIRPLASRGETPEAIAALWDTLENSAASVDERLQALRRLSPSLDPTYAARLNPLLNEAPLRLPVLQAFPDLLHSPETPARFSEFTADEKDALTRLAIRSDNVPLLLRWIDEEKLSSADVPADALTQLREISNPLLHAEILRHWGEATASTDPAQLIARWHSALTPDVLARADLKNGQLLYQRTCAACHKLFGEGGEIGPELTGGERTSLDHWLENIINPNALIGQGYELHHIEKKDGSTIVGMLAGETDSQIVLRFVDIETRIPKTDIAKNQPLGRSMMPEGLLDGLTEDQVRDLIAYLMAPPP